MLAHPLNPTKLSNGPASPHTEKCGKVVGEHCGATGRATGPRTVTMDIEWASRCNLQQRALMMDFERAARCNLTLRLASPTS
jgi:hypothetical protein